MGRVTLKYGWGPVTLKYGWCVSRAALPKTKRGGGHPKALNMGRVALKYGLGPVTLKYGWGRVKHKSHND